MIMYAFTVFTLVSDAGQQRGRGEDVSKDRSPSNRRPSHSPMLLEQPVCKATVPMAMSTKRIFKRHQAVISKLKRCLQER